MKITFEEFENKYFKELDLKPDYMRKGQILMNLLADIWNEEYKNISSVHYYDKTDIDCFYNDRLIPNTLKHLKSIWNDK